MVGDRYDTYNQLQVQLPASCKNVELNVNFFSLFSEKNELITSFESEKRPK